MLVSLLDGHVHAIDDRTGETKWSFSSGPPLVASAFEPDGAQAGEDRSAVFPGSDGSLYSFRPKGGGRTVEVRRTLPPPSTCVRLSMWVLLASPPWQLAPQEPGG